MERMLTLTLSHQPERGFVEPELTAALRERWGADVAVTHLNNEADEPELWVKLGYVGGSINPKIALKYMIVDVGGVNHGDLPTAINFLDWMRRFYPPGETLHLLNRYDPDEHLEITGDTSLDEMRKAFGERG